MEEHWLVPKHRLQVQLQPLPGGLQSAVTRATITRDIHYPLVPGRFVVKELLPGQRREADVYALLWTHLEQPPAARLLGVQSAGDTSYLFLEDVQSLSFWPWADIAFPLAVCRELAQLHDGTALPPASFTWDYDAELAASAASTLSGALRARDAAGVRYWRRVGDLKRVVACLPGLRSELLACGRTVLHGDVHPGNVIIRQGSPGDRVALIDWGRARVGSPLEDVASWLHSLGCWEPQARRRHDTLLQAYLAHRRGRPALTPELRRTYWFASASNGLAGAIRYHLSVLADLSSSAPMRQDSRHALREWERVVRRAAALLRTSGAC